MEEVYRELAEGAIKPYQLEALILERVYKGDEAKWVEANKDACLLRLRFLREKTGKELPNLEKFFVQIGDKEKKTTGIEQQVGGAVVPLGLGGPIKIKGEYADGEFFLPIATNEAALIAGLNRGCKAVNEAGGIKTLVSGDCMTRAPLVECPDIGNAKLIRDEILGRGELYEKIKEACERESRVSRLVEIQPFQLGRRIHLRFKFQTGDSMGMNSATRYASNGVKIILENFPDTKLITLSGNMCCDKKASSINVLLGRGKSVETEVLIPRDLIEKIYKVSPEEIVKLNFLKNYQGSALAGTLTGFNANAANTIAAMFMATGQDAAQIVESSTCFTHGEMDGDYLRFGVSLPCLEVATVGGGTSFGTAKECLEILECYGPGENPGDNARKLAEIIAAGVTAQDLNLIAAEVHEHELADSHISLARGRK